MKFEVGQIFENCSTKEQLVITHIDSKDIEYEYAFKDGKTRTNIRTVKSFIYMINTGAIKAISTTIDCVCGECRYCLTSIDYIESKFY